MWAHLSSTTLRMIRSSSYISLQHMAIRCASRGASPGCPAALLAMTGAALPGWQLLQAGKSVEGV